MEDRTRRAGRPDQSGDHRLPLPARNVEVEPGRAPTVRGDQHQLAWPTVDQPRGHRQPHRRDHQPDRTGRPRRTRHPPLPQRHQNHRPADRRATDHPPQVSWRMELHTSPRTSPNNRHIVKVISFQFLTRLAGPATPTTSARSAPNGRRTGRCGRRGEEYSPTRPTKPTSTMVGRHPDAECRVYTISSRKGTRCSLSSSFWIGRGNRWTKWTTNDREGPANSNSVRTSRRGVTATGP